MLPALFGSLLHYPLPPPTFTSKRLEMRRVLLGTGLVTDPEELAWLVENADLASPFAALRLLDRLASRARTGQVSGIPDLEGELESFLGTTEVFADFTERLQRKSRALPGTRAGLEEALDRLAEAPVASGLHLEAFRQPLSRARPGEADLLVDWLVESFPIRREDDHVLFASQLFRRWWRRQLAGADQREVGR